MVDREDYATARTLATVEHFGETFRVVRKRINGKPWRKYLTLCHGGVSVTSSLTRETDPAAIAKQYKELLSRTFKTREEMMPVLQNTIARNGPAPQGAS